MKNEGAAVEQLNNPEVDNQDIDQLLEQIESGEGEEGTDDQSPEAGGDPDIDNDDDDFGGNANEDLGEGDNNPDPGNDEDPCDEIEELLSGDGLDALDADAE